MKLLTKEYRNHIKMQESVVFAKKSLKINIWKIKKYCKVRDHCHYARKHRGAANRICNLKHRVTKKMPVTFHNGSNYDYHFIIKELWEEFKKKITCCGENTEKCIIFTVLIETKVTRIDKMEKKLQTIYLTYYNLLIVKNLWHAHYQILSLICLEES